MRASAEDTALELGTHLRRTQAGESIAFLPEQTKTKGGLAVMWTHPRGGGGCLSFSALTTLDYLFQLRLSRIL